MSLRRPSNSRTTKRAGIVRDVPGASGYFFALDFVTTKEEYIDTTEVTTVSATVIIKNDDIIIDYSHLYNKSDIDEVKFFFESSVKKDDIITVSKGQYLNEMTGNSTIHDISGTIIFQNFDENNMMVYAKTDSLDNPSSTYSIYDHKFFLSPVNWTTSVTYTKTELVNQIINMVPITSNNSFLKTFGIILPGDIIEFKIGADLYNFTVENYTSENTGTFGELISVKEPIPSDITTNNYMGTKLFGRVKRRTQISSDSEGIGACCCGTGSAMLCRNMSEDNCRDDCGGKWCRGRNCDSTYDTCAGCPDAQSSTQRSVVVNDAPTGDAPISFRSDPISPRNQRTRRRNAPATPIRTRRRNAPATPIQNEKLEKAKRNHIMSGSPTIYVMVELNSKGKSVYSFKHTDSPSGKQKDTLNFETGKTYKFIQSHKSNGISGFTRKDHPLSIGTCSSANCALNHLIVRSNKEPGINGSYLYFSPIERSTKALYTLCLNHRGMGGEVNIKSGRNITPTTSSRTSRDGGSPWTPAARGLPSAGLVAGGMGGYGLGGLNK